ncbi:lysozyme [Salmonella enterica subsp. salamae]|nr:lysozyme [Salmonella enterica subsp. salamae]ECJ2281031.1 lysozyme [Salmonella enterica subsp. salamae]HCC0888112.1 lysozyme [Salmonella enterica]
MPHTTPRFSPACIAFIKQWQGLSLEKYRDGQGKWVIGYGHALAQNEKYTFITREQAESLLLRDLEACDQQLQASLPVLDDRFQCEALIALIFSIGRQPFLLSDILSLINDSDISQPGITGL